MKKILILILVSAILFTGCGRSAVPPKGEEHVGTSTDEVAEAGKAESEVKASPEAETVILEDEETESETEGESETEKPTETTAAPVTTAHAHSYVKTGTVSATCSSEGYETYACACGESYSAALPMTAHSYQAAITAPTDFDEGYTVMVCSVCGYSDGNRTNIVPAKLSYTEQVFRLVNEERAKNGLAPLEYRYDLQKAADIRTAELRTSFSHTRPDGRKCFTVFEDIGFSEYYTAGENIAYGYPNPRAVVEGWMNSEGHRANILNPSFTGIVVGSDSSLNWVQLFVG